MVLDLREASFWYSSGTGGTLEVIDAGDGALEVLWHDVPLDNDLGTDKATEVGWLRRTPQQPPSSGGPVDLRHRGRRGSPLNGAPGSPRSGAPPSRRSGPWSSRP